jgi:hypothetical protein
MSNYYFVKQDVHKKKLKEKSEKINKTNFT